MNYVSWRIELIGRRPFAERMFHIYQAMADKLYKKKSKPGEMLELRRKSMVFLLKSYALGLRDMGSETNKERKDKLNYDLARVRDLLLGFLVENLPESAGVGGFEYKEFMKSEENREKLLQSFFEIIHDYGDWLVKDDDSFLSIMKVAIDLFGKEQMDIIMKKGAKKSKSGDENDLLKIDKEIKELEREKEDLERYIKDSEKHFLMGVDKEKRKDELKALEASLKEHKEYREKVLEDVEDVEDVEFFKGIAELPDESSFVGLEGVLGAVISTEQRVESPEDSEKDFFATMKRKRKKDVDEQELEVEGQEIKEEGEQSVKQAAEELCRLIYAVKKELAPPDSKLQAFEKREERGFPF